MMQLIKENISKFKIQDYLGKNLHVTVAESIRLRLKMLLLKMGQLTKCPKC